MVSHLAEPSADQSSTQMRTQSGTHQVSSQARFRRSDSSSALGTQSSASRAWRALSPPNQQQYLSRQSSSSSDSSPLPSPTLGASPLQFSLIRPEPTITKVRATYGPSGKPQGGRQLNFSSDSDSE